MKPTSEVIVDRAALQTAVSADGPPRRLMDADALVLAPSGMGLSVWTAVLDADIAAEGHWNRMLIVSRARVAAILARLKDATVRLTFTGTRLMVGPTSITVFDSAPFAEFSARRGRTPKPLRQGSLFRFEALDGPLKAKRRQLPARGLPLFR
jgi:hypothetical protein